MVNVLLRPDRTAYIVFSDIMSAFYAQKSLNSHYISEYDIRLEVSWYNAVDEVSEETEKKLLSELVEASLKEPIALPNNTAGINSPSPVSILYYFKLTTF